MRRFPILLLVFATSAIAQDSEPPACFADATYNALDFWLGKWDVYVGEELAGTNHIEKVLSGCAVMEHWHGAGGSEGKSLFFVTGEGRWKQVWATEWATRPGGVKEKDWQELDEPGQARFQGRIMLPDGRSYLDRTTLIRLPSGDVRQVIEHSTDDGVTWESGFDATYRRRN